MRVKARPSAPQRFLQKPGSWPATVATRASPACGPPNISECRKSAPCSKPPISPGCARPGCRRSDDSSPANPAFGYREQAVQPCDLCRRPLWVEVGHYLQIREMGVRGTEKPAGNPDRYRRQSMILVPLPHPAVVVQRMLPASAMTRRARPCRGCLRQRPCAGG